MIDREYQRRVEAVADRLGECLAAEDSTVALCALTAIACQWIPRILDEPDLPDEIRSGMVGVLVHNLLPKISRRHGEEP